MAVYRFRVYIEDDHEVYRDIEVQGKQRFSDLHACIVKSFNFKTKEPASYVTSDQSWYEGDSVVELDEQLEGDHQKIVRHINEPHQRFLCLTVSYKEVGLALELQKILKEEDGVVYPRCARSIGRQPYYTKPPPKPIVDEAEEALNLDVAQNDMFEGAGPSESEIERFQKDAEAANKSGTLKSPKVDMERLKRKSEAKKEEEDFGGFDLDDLM